jgi:hypothetical protein
MARRTQVIIPTAINVLTAVNDGIVASRRAGDDVNISLPSFRKRARLIVNEEGALQITTDVTTTDPTTFTR